MPAVSSASSYLALLDEDDSQLKSTALARLNSVVDNFWPEIFESIDKIETLYEDEGFKDRKLASLISAKVYYHLGELNDSLNFALGAGELFDINEDSEFVKTILSSCVDEYIEKRNDNNQADSIDPRLVAVVDRLFNACLKDGHYRQALGIALEARRADIVQNALVASASGKQEEGQASLLRYCVQQCTMHATALEWRREVLRLAHARYQAAAQPDHVAAAHCLLHLGDVAGLADLLIQALGDGSDTDQRRLAYQLAFELEDNASQQLLQAVAKALPQSDDATAPVSIMRGVLGGRVSVDLYLAFLYRCCKADSQILREAKAAVEQRSSICHNGLVLANALMHAGTTRDSFLRRNLEWLARATNWAKFSATASLGVIHRGHITEAFHLLAPYIPGPDGSSPPGGANSSDYYVGGGLFALGIIHSNHGASVEEYFQRQLRQPGASDIVRHGAALGVGAASIATHNMALYDTLKDVLYSDSAVAGEAAALSMGLVMAGSGAERPVREMLSYATDTEHEKIERGLAIGLALIMVGKEEAAIGLIEQLQRHKSPLLRYGAMHTIALAFVGTGDNDAIARCLHFAVADPNDDVRRAAVTALGFILSRAGDQCCRVVALLAESYNPHVRYGSAMALAISCVGTANPEALRLLKPMLTDTVDFVRQGALVAHALLLMQLSATNPKVTEIRELFASTIGDKHEAVMTKFGALLATGIIDAGGRNSIISLQSRSGLIRPSAVIGLTLFLHHWHWYPCVHFLSLALQPTAVIALNEKLEMVNFDFKSNAPPSQFAYPPMLKPKKEKAKTKVKTAELSYTKKAKKASNDMQVDDKKKNEDDDNDKKDEDGDEEEKDAKKEPEPTSEVLNNPARVTQQQWSVISFDVDERYTPIIANSDVATVCPFIVLKDTKPNEPESLVVAPAEAPSTTSSEPAASTATVAASSTAAGGVSAMAEDGDAAPPASFEFDESKED